MAHLIYSSIPYKAIVKILFYSNIKSSHLVIKIFGMFGPLLFKINDKSTEVIAEICL